MFLKDHCAKTNEEQCRLEWGDARGEEAQAG